MTTADLGLSLSRYRCEELGLDPRRLLRAALKDLGCRQFRLMSYWNLHEPSRGEYRFRELDRQLDMVAEFGGSVSLCIGKRQPRWPECHIPDWALSFSKTEWHQALYQFLTLVVLRYKNHPALESWQLENEALLKSFGRCQDGDYSRARLRKEARIVRSLDSAHPLVMTLSDSWGVPFRSPKPDKYGLTVYRQTTVSDGEVAVSRRLPMFYWLRGQAVQSVTRRPVFIHELQAEPWTNVPILGVPLEVQLRLFNAGTLRENVNFAARTDLRPIYLWGLEWWYWLKIRHHNPSIWEAAGELFWENTPQAPNQA